MLSSGNSENYRVEDRVAGSDSWVKGLRVSIPGAMNHMTAEDLAILLCAVCVCVLSTLLAVHKLCLAGASRGRRRLYQSLFAAVVAGSGVWSTHFLAMLACSGTMGTSYGLALTALSAVYVIFAMALAWQVHLRTASRSRNAASAALMTIAVGGMHFMGLLAAQGNVNNLPTLPRGVAAILIGFAFFYCGTLVLRRQRGRRRLLAAGLWILGVVSLHFTATSLMSDMGNVGIYSDTDAQASVSLVLAVTVGTFIFLLLASGIGLAEYMNSRRLSKEHERAYEFAEATVEGLVIINEGRIVDANSAFRRIVGWSKVVTSSLALKFPDLPDEETLGELSGQDTGIETDLLLHDGLRIPVEVFVRTASWRGRKHMVLAVLDLRSRRAAEKRIRDVSSQDMLTGLSNRLFLVSELKEFIAWSRDKRSVVLLVLIDVDRFKAINETGGYTAGDAVLCQVGKVLRDVAPKGAAVARIAGDEFAIACIAPATDDSARAIVSSISMALHRELGDDEVSSVSVCLGFATVTDTDSVSDSVLLHRATTALLEAKLAGRGAVREYDSNFDLTLQKRAKMESELRQAIDNDELFLEYQPILETATNSITGYEALVRWKHPVRGRIPPDEFIGVAEECGLIADLGKWVVERACLEAASWGNTLGISVNVSPVQLRDSDIETIISKAVTDAGIDAQRLSIEITESTFLHHAAKNIEILGKIHDKGVGIVMDDFGTGYSSLSYLRSFPFDKVKIDRSFIRDMLTDTQAAAIVDAVISLGHGLGVGIVAEGIETSDQLEYLSQRSCSLVQGYYIGRPAPKVIVDNRKVTPQVERV